MLVDLHVGGKNYKVSVKGMRLNAIKVRTVLFVLLVLSGGRMLLTAKDVAFRFGINPRKVYRLWDAGVMGSFRLDDSPKSRRYCEEGDVKDYIAKRRAKERQARL